MMKMTTYRPYGLNGGFDRFFNDLFGQAIGNDAPHTRPALNVRTDEDGYYLELAAPGLQKEAFEIEIDGERLTLSAEWKAATDQPTGDYTRREFDFRSFSRTFQLPEDVETTGVAARYESGILLLELPRKEAAKPQPAQRISIS